MATPKQFVETLAVGSGAVAGLASVPSGADNAIIRVEGATARWSDTSGSFLTGSTGILISPADPPMRIGNLVNFRVIPLGSGFVLQSGYYQGFYGSL